MCTALVLGPRWDEGKIEGSISKSSVAGTYYPSDQASETLSVYSSDSNILSKTLYKEGMTSPCQGHRIQSDIFAHPLYKAWFEDILLKVT